jgi:cytochrome b pre-mRNA-processing protein 3
MIFAKFFAKPPEPAKPLYEAIVAAARQPLFYTEMTVPDTVDGRFDLLLLHLTLVIERLQGEANPFCQNLVNLFCKDMDGNLREMGAGDLSVGKKVRRMAEAFQGRYQAYGAAHDQATMAEALKRNVYAGIENSNAQALSQYALAARLLLRQQNAADIQGGKVAFR